MIFLTFCNLLSLHFVYKSSTARRSVDLYFFSRRSLIVKKLLVVLLGVSFFSLVFLSSCKQRQELDDELSSSSGLVTPYSDMDDFSLARSVTFEDETVVNWKVARFFALLKKNRF
ncbi:MAG: hypothetical protein ACTTJ6_07535 [Treponema sp.]